MTVLMEVAIALIALAGSGIVLYTAALLIKEFNKKPDSKK